MNVSLPEQVKNAYDFEKYLDSRTEELKKSNYSSPEEEKKAATVDLIRMN